MTGDIRVIRRGPIDGAPSGMEAIVCGDLDRLGGRMIILRCRACGRGSVARLIREGASFWPDGEIAVAHATDDCPVFVVAIAAASAGRAS